MSAPTPPPLLQVIGLEKSFGGLRATCDVSFDVAAGSLTALIGPNGAGKTTLFNLITNLMAPTTGDVRFQGASLLGQSSARIAGRGVIRTFQSARVFPGLTVLENVLAGHHRVGATRLLDEMLWRPRALRQEHALRQRALELLDLVGLARFADDHAVDLPMGAQKLLEVIRALMARPILLLLDEPAAGLNDIETGELARLLTSICASGVTILLVEHNMRLVMGIADQVIALEAGSIIAAGPPALVQRDQRVIDAYLGAEPVA